MEEYTRKTIKFYDDNVEEYINNTENLQDEVWLNGFAELIPKKGKVLDLGCAYGRDTKTFVKLGFDSYGVDLSKKFIEYAKKKVPKADFKVANVMKIPFEKDFFDGVWCSATLLHIAKKDFSKALHEIARVLKRDGVLYLHLKKGDGEAFIEDKRYGGVKKFYSYFQRNEIQDYLRKSGFSIVEFELVYDEKEEYRNSGLIYIIARK